MDGHDVASELARPRLRRRNPEGVDEQKVRRVVGLGVLKHRKHVGKELRVPAPDLKNSMTVRTRNCKTEVRPLLSKDNDESIETLVL